MDNIDLIDKMYAEEQEMWEDFENEMKNDIEFWKQQNKKEE